MQNEMSPWALSAASQMADLPNEPIRSYKINSHTFSVYLLNDTLWLMVNWNSSSRAAFRTAFSPNGLAIENITDNDDSLIVQLTASTGRFEVEISFPDKDELLVHYQVKFKPNAPLFIPFWPKDVLIPGKPGDANPPAGEHYVAQIGIRTGLNYAGMKGHNHGSFLYFQNLGALNDYCLLTETSLAGTVGGQWPEFGFSLPPTNQKPIPAKKELIISDAYISFDTQTPQDQFQTAEGFISHLAAIYKVLPRPDTKYHDYPDVLQKSLHNLSNNKGCWSQHNGCSYLNAYVCDYATPPEIMVQLAVLLPIWDYTEWCDEELPCANQIYDNLHTFYSPELQTIKRWLPAAEDKLDESEEQKAPNVMDAWYLHHPLLNLARMALKGDKLAKDLFLKSVPFAVKVAHRFNYQWPVFYDMNTLEVIKEETSPGMGGEKDVAGVYAQVMLQAWDLTGDRAYFEEAEKAVQSLMQFGFDIFYQANNTAFATKALLRLYKETQKKIYLDFCHLHIANLLKNMAIWECNYGYGKNFPLFFALFPLNDAPYVAVYEEQESFAAIQDLLQIAQDVDNFLPSASLLLADYVKYLINRAVYYYPPMLPKEMLAEQTKTGELDAKLWVAVEDIHDGWEKAGAVGQEVYGAGLCFGIVPRHYIRIPNQHFMIYVDYPTGRKKIRGNKLTMDILGSSELTCRFSIIKHNNIKLPGIKITAGNEQDQGVFDKGLKEGKKEFIIHGGQTLIITWENKQIPSTQIQQQKGELWKTQ